MSFYSTIAAYYDAIFPFNPTQLSFIVSHSPLKNHPKLIEIGSACGVLTDACAQSGYQVRGLELDNTMVALAQIKYPNIPFYGENMLHIEKVFSRESCNTIVCFGNTFVHLRQTQQMLNFLKGAYQTLAPQGKLLVQIINYDRIIDQKINALPTISNDDITFARNYELISDIELLFKATLTVHTDNTSTQNIQKLYPLRKENFEAMAKETGFSCKTFGNFKGDKWSADEMQSIFVCTK